MIDVNYFLKILSVLYYVWSETLKSVYRSLMTPYHPLKISFFPIRECNSERPQAEFPLQHRKCFHSADDWRIDEMQTTVMPDKSDGRVTCFRKLHTKECGLSHRNPKRFVALEVSLTEFQLQAFKRKDL